MLFIHQWIVDIHTHTHTHFPKAIAPWWEHRNHCPTWWWTAQFHFYGYVRLYLRFAFYRALAQLRLNFPLFPFNAQNKIWRKIITEIKALIFSFRRVLEQFLCRNDVITQLVSVLVALSRRPRLGDASGRSFAFSSLPYFPHRRGVRARLCRMRKAKVLRAPVS